MLGRKDRTERTVHIHCSAECQAQDATYFFVQFLRTYFARFDTLQIRHSQIIVIISVAAAIGKTIRPASELHIKTVCNSLISIVRAAPVGNDHTVEAPFASQNIVQQILVVAGMLTFIQVISSHDRPRFTFLNGRLESGQIDFIQGTVVYYDIGGVAVDFLIVQRIVLHAGCHPILLYALHVRNHHTGSQVRVFAHVLKVTSVQRSTININTGSQKNGLVTIACFFTNAFSIKHGHLGVPCSRQTGQCRKSYTRVIGPSGLIPFIPKNFGTDSVRTVRHPKFRNTQTGHTRTAEFTLCMQHGYLFFHGQPLQRIFYSYFHRFARIQIYRFLLRKERKSNSECETE